MNFTDDDSLLQDFDFDEELSDTLGYSIFANMKKIEGENITRIVFENRSNVI